MQAQTFGVFQMHAFSSMARLLLPTAVSAATALTLLGGCSSDDEENGSEAGTAGGPQGDPDTDINLTEPTGPSGGATAVNPDPLPTNETDGWVDIDPETKSAFLGDACDGWSVEPESSPSVLEFVLDVSGTMNGPTESTGDRTKWEVSRDALITSLDSLPSNIAVGLTFYPNMDNGGSKDEAQDHTPCIETRDNVPPANLGPLGSDHRAALRNALESVDPEPRGSTPTHDAMNIAYDILNQHDTGFDKYVVLVTDGQPTLVEGCYGRAAPRAPEDPAPIVQEIAERLQNERIKTFIVGSPGSEVNVGTGEDIRDWLSAAARAGGTDAQPCDDSGDPSFCHFDLTEADSFGDALTGALGTIGNWVLSCEYVVPETTFEGEEIDPNLVNIIFTDGSGQPHLLLPNGDPACPVGWRYVDDAHTRIEICGGTCESLKADGRASLDLAYGCATGDIPVR